MHTFAVYLQTHNTCDLFRKSLLTEGLNFVVQVFRLFPSFDQIRCVCMCEYLCPPMYCTVYVCAVSYGYIRIKAHNNYDAGRALSCVVLSSIIASFLDKRSYYFIPSQSFLECVTLRF